MAVICLWSSRIPTQGGPRPAVLDRARTRNVARAEGLRCATTSTQPNAEVPSRCCGSQCSRNNHDFYPALCKSTCSTPLSYHACTMHCRPPDTYMSNLGLGSQHKRKIIFGQNGNAKRYSCTRAHTMCCLYLAELKISNISSNLARSFDDDEATIPDCRSFISKPKPLGSVSAILRSWPSRCRGEHTLVRKEQKPSTIHFFSLFIANDCELNCHDHLPLRQVKQFWTEPRHTQASEPTPLIRFVKHRTQRVNQPQHHLVDLASSCRYLSLVPSTSSIPTTSHTCNVTEPNRTCSSFSANRILQPIKSNQIKFSSAQLSHAATERPSTKGQRLEPRKFFLDGILPLLHLLGGTPPQGQDGQPQAEESAAPPWCRCTDRGRRQVQAGSPSRPGGSAAVHRPAALVVHPRELGRVGRR